MALEPKNVIAGDEEENAELRDMTRRFWIGAVLSAAGVRPRDGAPVPVGTPEWVAERFVALGAIHSQHAGGALGGLAVLRARLAIARQPLAQHVYAHRDRRRRGLSLQRGRRCCCPRSLPAVVSQQHGKIGVYFEAAAIITVLVLLGQVLELRARSRTGSAIRALLDLAPNTARVVRDGEETRRAAR